MTNKATRFVLSLTIGLVIGVVIHHALYRMALPVEPFIYMAF